MIFKYQAVIYPPKKYTPKGVKKGSHIFSIAGVIGINTLQKDVVVDLIKRRIWIRELGACFFVADYSRPYDILYLERRLSKLSRAIAQRLCDEGWAYNHEVPSRYHLPDFYLQTNLPVVLEPASR